MMWGVVLVDLTCRPSLLPRAPLAIMAIGVQIIMGMGPTKIFNAR